MSAMQQFENQQYLNIETFRKNGQGVKTPVWFAQEGETLWVWTEITSGKAKRIRRSGQINVAPSQADGTLVGDWVPATAVADDSPAAIAHVKKLFGKKYGLMFPVFGLLGKLRRARYTSIRITLAG